MLAGGGADNGGTITRLELPGPAGATGLRLPPRLDTVGLEDVPSVLARAFTTLTSGATVVGMIPTVLPLLCSMRACCCCLRPIIDLTCSIALGSSSGMEKPITTGDMPLSIEGRLTSVLMGRVRRFLAGLGESGLEGGLKVGSHGFWGAADGPCLGGGNESASYSCLTRTVRGDLRPLREMETKVSGGRESRRETYSEPVPSSFSAPPVSECSRFLVNLGSRLGGCGEARPERDRSKGESRCWMGGSELFMSGILLSDWDEPNVCAKEGSDWGGWAVAISLGGLAMGGALPSEGKANECRSRSGGCRVC